ncbi:MAG: helix-turn-helix domain-containing protein [Actinobacteria bacterium]|nr:helix-turn-helix domain-containing protein [Actinomycetota bacterium]
MELKTKIPQEHELLTIDEVRAWLRLGRTRLNELLQTGELPSFKVGRRRFLRRDDVLNWLERHRQQPGAYPMSEEPERVAHHDQP